MRQLPVLRPIPAASCAALLVACLHNEGPTTTGPLVATTTIDSTVGTVATTSLVVDVSQHVHVLYSQDGVFQAGIVYLSAGSSKGNLKFAQSN